MADKVKRCRAEITSYKELRQKIKKGDFTIADLKPLRPQTPIPATPLPSTDAEEVVVDKEVAVPEIAVNEGTPGVEAGQKNVLSEYKSPLEHMEYLE